ncbi:MAG: hypothetical protein QM831_03695 [Kofleriaceae bacterium]
MTAVPISIDAAPWLGLLAAHVGLQPALRLAEQPIRDAEKVLKSVIPNDIIALLAIEGRTAGDLVQLTSGVRTFYKATERGLIEQLKFAHVMVRQINDDDSEPIFAAYRVTKDREASQLVRWNVRKPSPGEHPYSLESYVRQIHGITAPRGPQPPLVTLAKPEAEYVTHPKFGRGKVLRRGEGKVTVEFTDTTRTLGESFVTPE